MCGFAGFYCDTPYPEEILKKMAGAIAHRGPDDEGFYIDGQLGFGFRRLSIIDLSTGHQPMFNEDYTVAIVFNGEIYNYKSLHEELKGLGHRFKSVSDTETLVHLYEEYGVGMLQKLRGMFAFVIYDKKKNRVFGARDIFGIKPFYYYLKDDVFLFSSEIKAFLPHPKFEKELDIERLPEYLCFEYIPGEKTMFKNVKKLLGGECFVYENGALTISKYSSDITYDIDESKTLDDWKGEIKEAFEDSCTSHLISDVEVGCFLSSGVDSSLVTNEMHKTGSVMSFSIGYDEERYSELADSSELSKAIGVENYPCKVGAEEFFSEFGNVQYHMDEPLPNPSAVPLYFLAKHASKYVKVVLSGEGADELFGGYDYYRECIPFSKYEKVPHIIRKAIGGIAHVLPKFHGRRFLIRGVNGLETRYVRNEYVFSEKERDKYLAFQQVSPHPRELVEKTFNEVKGLDDITRMQYADIHVWMLYDILQKADKMSMASSLELRVPFLDKKVLKVAMAIPSRFRVSNAQTKIALREYARDELPQKTALMKKRGFPSPLAEWLKQDKYYQIVKSAFESETAGAFFNQKEILSLLERHHEGITNDMKRIWTIYTFLVWHDEFFVKR